MRSKSLEREKELQARALLEKTERMESEIFRRAQALQDANKALREGEARLQQLNDTLEERVAERPPARGRDRRAGARPKPPCGKRRNSRPLGGWPAASPP